MITPEATCKQDIEFHFEFSEFSLCKNVFMSQNIVADVRGSSISLLFYLNDSLIMILVPCKMLDRMLDPSYASEHLIGQLRPCG